MAQISEPYKAGSGPIRSGLAQQQNSSIISPIISTIFPNHQQSVSNTKMKASIFAAAAVSLASMANAFDPRCWEQLELAYPHNWIAGPRLFPGAVIAGYHADLYEYNADSWAEHIVDECEKFDRGTSTISFSAINSGSTGGRYWFGYCFGGGPTTQQSYVRERGVADSIAFSIIEGSKPHHWN